MLPKFVHTSGGTDTAVGSTNDGDFGGFIQTTGNLNGTTRAREMYTPFPLTMEEMGITIQVAFAVASTNIIETNVNSSAAQSETVPADAITVTLTANATGIFSNTGGVNIPADNYYCFVFSSDDATDPAAMQGGYCVNIQG